MKTYGNVVWIRCSVVPILSSDILFKCLFIWLCWVLVAACGIQFPNQGSNLGPLHWEQSLSPWTTRDVPFLNFKYFFFFFKQRKVYHKAKQGEWVACTQKPWTEKTFIFKIYFFRAVLGSERNWEEGTEVSCVPPAPTHALHPLHQSGTGYSWWTCVD